MTLRALAVILAIARTAHADVTTLPDTKATIDLKAWNPAPATGVVLGATGPANELLAITRAAVPNPDAWRPNKRDAYADKIEQGIAAKVKGYRRLSRKLGATGTVPMLDLEAKRDDGATLVVRVLLFRTYALALAIEIPNRGAPAAARAIAQTFTVPPG